MRSKSVGAVVLAVATVVTSCATTPPAIPVIGEASRVSALNGSWSGQYFSSMTGRHGSINFALAAGADTAYGDVLILPNTTRSLTGNDAQAPSKPEGSVPVLVRFVLAAQDSVFGTLQPYEDPASGGVLDTRFTGRLHGDRIDGYYFTRNGKTGESTSGEWSVRRMRAERAPK